MFTTGDLVGAFPCTAAITLILLQCQVYFNCPYIYTSTVIIITMLTFCTVAYIFIAGDQKVILHCCTVEFFLFTMLTFYILYCTYLFHQNLILHCCTVGLICTTNLTHTSYWITVPILSSLHSCTSYPQQAILLLPQSC